MTLPRTVGLRIIDFKRNKYDIPAKVASIEYDPNRTSNIALLHYADGEKRYILAPVGLTVGDTVISSDKADIKTGNSLSLEAIPVGTVIHNIEQNPGKGGQIARAAGISAQLMAKEGKYAIIRLKFLPPVFCLGASRLFSGLVVVISSNMETDMKRRAGLVGLYLLIAIIPFPPD